MSIFADIKDGYQVEKAVIDTLRKWFPTYLRELELQRALAPGSLPDPMSYNTFTTFDNYPENALPAIVAISPGLAAAPLKEGDGKYRALWMIGVAAVCMARTKEDAFRVARLYASAGRAIMLQQSSLGGFARGVDWIDESYDELGPEERALSAGSGFYHVEVSNVTTAGAGPNEPADPETQPGSEWPVVDETSITIENEGVS